MESNNKHPGSTQAVYYSTVAIECCALGFYKMLRKMSLHYCFD